MEFRRLKRLVGLQHYLRVVKRYLSIFKPSAYEKNGYPPLRFR